MPLEEVLIEPESVSKAPKIPGTLEVHMVRRSFSSDGVCKLEFYHTIADQSWYRKDSDLVVCGHPELPLSFDPSMACAKCHVHYKKNEEWLECTMCDQ